MYKKTQFGEVIIISLGLSLLLIGYFEAYYSDFFILPVAGILLLSLILFYKLTVIVDNINVEIIFGIGLIRKKFRLKDIHSCKSVKNPWYYGWGIHLTPRGWLYNVSGFYAVEILMKDGKKYRIGTNNPEELMGSIKNSHR
jgi:hypothetical protein